MKKKSKLAVMSDIVYALTFIAILIKYVVRRKSKRRDNLLKKINKKLSTFKPV